MQASISEREVRDELAHILASPLFSRAKTLRNVLRYIVEESLSGRGGELSKRSIAANVLTGPADKSDHIGTYVARTREKLEKYYQKMGPASSIRITLERGNYQANWIRLDDSSSLISERDETVKPADFKRFVELLIDVIGIDSAERDARMRRYIESSSKFSTRFPGHEGRSEFVEFFEWISKLPRPRQQELLPFTEMVSLAISLGIHPVLIDHLLSRMREEAQCIVLEFAGAASEIKSDEVKVDSCIAGKFKRAGHRSQPPSYGERVAYFIPTDSLQGANAAFVQLDLEPGGHSDYHNHPGDEFIFVLQGSVRIRLQASGAAISLGKGDYIHFHAEQPHLAENRSAGNEVARLFIVRYQQHRRETFQQEPYSRTEMRAHVCDTLSSVAQSSKRALTSFERAWVLGAIASPVKYDPDHVPSEFQNRYGLARLLQHHLSADQGGRSEAEQMVDNLLQGKVTMEPRALIDKCRKLFHMDVEPAMWGFLYPSVAPTAIVRRSRKADLGNDWIRVRDICKQELPDGVDYEIPRRSLACSDLSVSWLTLAPGKVTAPSMHVGTVLVIPMEGEGRIEYLGPHMKPIPVCTVRESTALVHFRGHERHRIGNDGDQPFEALVVRSFVENLVDAAEQEH